MLFSADILTEKSTTVFAPKQSSLGITKGVITQWIIFFPAGSRGALRFRVRIGTRYLLPMTPSSYMKGENVQLTIPDWHYIKDAPFKLDIYSWNNDSIDDHEFKLDVSIMPLWTLYPFSEQFAQLLREERLQAIL